MSYKLTINEDEVARYLGYKEHEVEEQTKEDIKEATLLLRKESNFKLEYKVFDITHGDVISVLGTNLTLPGTNIKTLLKECDSCILLAVTLGQSVDLLIRKTQALSLHKGVILDMCASSMVDNLCDQLEASLKEKWDAKGEFFTDRFSPGYGDLPLSIQSTFCNVLETSKKMGLNVTKENIMIPRKSITAIIGIAKTPQPMRIKGCNYCDFYEHCEIRKGGHVCG